MNNINKDYLIFFICEGNACRSPFAEAALKAKLAQHPELKVQVGSCGTLNWGKNPRDQMMVDLAAEKGVQMTGMTTYMSHELLMSADRIVVFTANQRDEVTRILDYSHWNRIILFNLLAFGQISDVEDPHYQSEAVYKRVIDHILEGCNNLVSKWMEQPPVAFPSEQ